MPSTKNREIALDITKNWAKTITVAGKGGPLEPFKALFASTVYVVLQNGEGGEVEFSLGTDPDKCNMTWEQFAETAFKDLEAQGYEETTSNCLGILGNRLILETGRINKAGELYLTATSLVEFNDDGKVVGFEAFTEIVVDTEALAKSTKAS